MLTFTGGRDRQEQITRSIKERISVVRIWPLPFSGDDSVLGGRDTQDLKLSIRIGPRLVVCPTRTHFLGLDFDVLSRAPGFVNHQAGDTSGLRNCRGCAEN